MDHAIIVALVWGPGNHEVQLHGLPPDVAEHLASFWGSGATFSGADRHGMALAHRGVFIVVRSCSLWRRRETTSQHTQITLRGTP